MRPTIVVILFLAALAVASAVAAANPDATPKTATAALSTPVFVVTGGGYGHGVGLNQYGAFGQARAGRGYTDILSFYFPDTVLAKAPVSKLRVLVADARLTVRIGSAAPFTVVDASGAAMQLPVGEIVLRPALKVRGPDGTLVQLQAPLTFRAGSGSTLTLDGKGYRGTFRVAVVEKRLQVIDTVALDAYVLGVVPGEMPKEWPSAALQAQAVAARSYALANLVKGKDYDLYSDPRSQAYYGVAAESPQTTAAVQATKGQVLLYDGKVATGFYYASSGGHTASSLDVYGVDLPYLQARDDPWDTLSPYHRWEPRSYTAVSLAKAFGLSAPVLDVEVVETPSDRPASVTLVKKTGQSILLTAADVRARLGLRSTAVRIGVLRVAKPKPPAGAGKPVVVSGLARDVDRPLLEKQATNGAWLPSAKVAPGDDGSFAVTVRPKVTSTYRLSADGQAGPSVTVPVPAGQPQ
jgi:stage II sporulation protein D